MRGNSSHNILGVWQATIKIELKNSKVDEKRKRNEKKSTKKEILIKIENV